MKRTDFLKILGAGTMTAIAGSLLSSCKSSTTPTPPTPDSKDFISTSVDNHSHTITLKKTDLQSPPSGGISRETSTVNEHHHTFTMTQAELSQVNNGTVVEIDTADTNAHHHRFHLQSWFW